MPVKSFNSAVLKWPEKEDIIRQAQNWAEVTSHSHPEIVLILCFGSVVSSHWGVGSDCDIMLIVDDSDTPFMRRSIRFDTSAIDVPTDLLVYTVEELESMRKKKGRFIREIDRQSLLLFKR